jgi:hypothetical protein
MTCITAIAAAAIMAKAAVAAEREWLSLGSKHWAPTITAKSGIGTANASAEARVTREDIEGWCANWSPGDKGCAQRELANPDTKKTYRASADCIAGRITPVDGRSYTLAGHWDHSDIGGGRTRWHDAAGKIVGRDNASGGLSISQQWEVLCPNNRKAGVTAGTKTPAAPKGVQAAPPSRFSVGQIVEARYGREWLRGRINKISQVRGAHGPELAYDVRLDNGKRGVLPARMLRKLSQN